MKSRQGSLHEMYEGVVSSLGAMWPLIEDEAEGRRLVVTAPEGGEGVTTIATAAAIGMAQVLNVQTLLIEANFHAPSLARRLELPEDPGLAEVLRGEVSIREGVQETEVKNLSVMTAGRNVDHTPIGHFSSPTARALFRVDGGPDETDSDADPDSAEETEGPMLVVDTPPLLRHPESLLLARRIGRVVVVLRARKTKSPVAEATLKLLRDAGVEPMGVILNDYRQSAFHMLSPGSFAWIHGK